MTASPKITDRITPETLKSWLHDSQEIALLDIREHGQYGEAHLFYAVNLPYSRLEVDAARLVPRTATRLVVYDASDETMAERVAQRLKAIGYTAVHVLAGGAAGWKANGYQLFAGVHVPSKTFGELAELAFRTPHMSAAELKRRQDAGEPLVILDGRPFSEYRKMNIPGGICCPNGELALRSSALIPDDSTPVVINCAGRTRSIIGAQTLINLGLPNPVYALENGTQGWYLADQALEHGADRRFPDTIPADALPALRERAQRYAARFPAPAVSTQTLLQWREAGDHSLYLCDVRTAEEFRAGTVAGAQHTPGGQLIQATDLYVGTRGSRIVVFDDEHVRAPVVAGWLRLMGWDAYVLQDAAALFAPPTAQPMPGSVAMPPSVASEALVHHLREGATLLDLRPSMAFRAARIAQAVWSNRTLLEQDTHRPTGPVIVLAADAGVAALGAATLVSHGVPVLGIHTESTNAWRAAGLEVIATPDDPLDDICIDYLFFVHDRHAGNKEAARQYLKWETGLIAQIDAQERAGFCLPDPT